MKPLEQRKQEFKNLISEIGKEYQDWQREKFFNYWSQHAEPVRKNTKMLWEKQKIFQIKNRMATFFKSNPKRYAKKRQREQQEKISKLMEL